MGGKRHKLPLLTLMFLSVVLVLLLTLFCLIITAVSVLRFHFIHSYVMVLHCIGWLSHPVRGGRTVGPFKSRPNFPTSKSLIPRVCLVKRYTNLLYQKLCFDVPYQSKTENESVSSPMEFSFDFSAV